MAAIDAAIFMSRMLQEILVSFQRVPTSVGNSTRHARDMADQRKRKPFAGRGFGPVVHALVHIGQECVDVQGAEFLVRVAATCMFWQRSRMICAALENAESAGFLRRPPQKMLSFGFCSPLTR